MTITDVLRSGVLASLAVFACGLGSALAASAGSLCDMDRTLSEPHPLAHQYGTRWRPAAAVPAPRPFAAPVEAPIRTGGGTTRAVLVR